MRSAYLDDSTVKSIRDAMSSAEWLALWISYEGGLRVGDVVALRRDCFDGVRVRYTAAKTGKDGAFEPSEALAAAITAACGGGRTGWLFPSPRDASRHLTRQAVWYRVKRACKRSGIDPRGVSPHSFRKVFAVRLFSRVGLELTQQALQHDRTSTTEIYALSDFTSGKNASKPLLRRDIAKVADIVYGLLCGRRGLSPV